MVNNRMGRGNEARFFGRNAHLVSTLVFVIASISLVVGAESSATQKYEQLPQLRASAFLPPNLVQGLDFRVNDKVVNDGVLNTYTIESSFGQFTAVTTAKLRQRIGEVHALRQMEAVRQSDTFKKSLVESGKDTLETAKQIVTDPVGTASGAVSGVRKAFGRAGEALFGSRRSEAEDSRFESFIGLSNTKRSFAFDFGVDVYSDNEILQDRLDELARASYAGGLTYSAALSLVPGGVGIAISATGMTQLANDIYRTTAPADLRIMNRQKLNSIGVRKDATETFLDNAIFSPREQTELVLALERMPETKKRELFVLFAALTDDRDMAFFRQRQAQMYAGYNKMVSPIDTFIAFGDFVGARTKHGHIVFNVPVDYLVWTEWMANVVDGIDQLVATMPGVVAKEIVLAGTLTSHARQQLGVRGWVVKDKAEELSSVK